MKRNDLTIYIGFTNSPGDQLGVLTTEVKNEDFFCHGAKVNEIWWS